MFKWTFQVYELATAVEQAEGPLAFSKAIRKSHLTAILALSCAIYHRA